MREKKGGKEKSEGGRRERRKSRIMLFIILITYIDYLANINRLEAFPSLGLYADSLVLSSAMFISNLTKD